VRLLIWSRSESVDTGSVGVKRGILEGNRLRQHLESPRRALWSRNRDRQQPESPRRARLARITLRSSLRSGACGSVLRRPRLALSVHQALHCIARATEALANDYPAPPWARRARSWLRRSRNRWRSAPPSPWRVTLPPATARPGARFIARPGEGQGCGAACRPGGLKGRGGLREPWTRKHPRRAAGPRDRSTPRAFWLLAVVLMTPSPPRGFPFVSGNASLVGSITSNQYAIPLHQSREYNRDDELL